MRSSPRTYPCGRPTPARSTRRCSRRAPPATAACAARGISSLSRSSSCHGGLMITSPAPLIPTCASVGQHVQRHVENLADAGSLDVAMEADRARAVGERIPDAVHAGRPAFVRNFERGEHLVELELGFVRRVDEHEAAAFARRQVRLESRVAVAVDHRDEPLAADRRPQCVRFLRQLLDQDEPVGRAPHPRHDDRRAGVCRDRTVILAGGLAHQPDVRGDLRRQRCGWQFEQPADAGLVLAAALRLCLAQVVDAAAGVRVEEQERGRTSSSGARRASSAPRASARPRSCRRGRRGGSSWLRGVLQRMRTHDRRAMVRAATFVLGCTVLAACASEVRPSARPRPSLRQRQRLCRGQS